MIDFPMSQYAGSRDRERAIFEYIKKLEAIRDSYKESAEFFEKENAALKARVSELEQRQSIVRARCQHYLKNETEPFDGWLAEIKFIHSILITPPKEKANG